MKNGQSKILGYFSQDKNESIEQAASICGLERLETTLYVSSKEAVEDFITHEKRKPKAIYKIIIKRVK